MIFIHENIVQNTNEIKNKYEWFLLPNFNYQYKYRLTKLNNILNQTSILCKQSIISDDKYSHITVQLQKIYGEKTVYRNIYIKFSKE